MLPHLQPSDLVQGPPPRSPARSTPFQKDLGSPLNPDSLGEPRQRLFPRGPRRSEHPPAPRADRATRSRRRAGPAAPAPGRSVRLGTARPAPGMTLGPAAPLPHSRPRSCPCAPLLSDLPLAKCVMSAGRSGDTCCRPRRASPAPRVGASGRAGPRTPRSGGRARRGGLAELCAQGPEPEDPGARGAAVRPEPAARRVRSPGARPPARAAALTCQYLRRAGTRP